MSEIDSYLKAKEQQIELEKMIAWQEFYQECNNDWKAKKIGYKIEKFKKRMI